MRIIDLTHTITETMPVYPGTEPPMLEPANTYEKDGFRETKLTMYSHTGTHIDAPGHLFEHRTRLDEFPAEQFVGKALVIDCRDLTGRIPLERVRAYGDLADLADFLLFNTGWSRRWGTEAYFDGYPYLTEDVLDMILCGSYKGIGFDTIGLDPISDINLTLHKKLFEKTDIINIENLTNLDLCGSKRFDFYCLPLKFAEADGAPARAIARIEEP